jgi:hypothetical protein
MDLKRIYEKLDSLSVALFSNGWLFIVPYVVLYLSFKYLHLPASGLKTIFICFHLGLIVLFINYLRTISKKSEVADFVFWIGLFLLFLVPGAYLEFPSDPWEHFRRIYAWQSFRTIAENPLSDKFSYFWGWTLVYMVPPLYRRTALGVYGAFWELVLAYQFYLLALRLGFSKSWARIQVLATVCLFGANVFSFYRYYALSSTIVAYIAYLAALIILIDVLDGERKKALLLPLLVLIIYCNHLQEFVFLGISATALLIYKAFETQHLRRALNYLLPLALIVSWLIGSWVVSNPQFIPIPGFNPVSPSISSWGTFRIWDLKMPYFEAIAVHGLVSLTLAIVLFNKYRRVALLTLAPVGLMLFFPFVLFFSAMVGNYDYQISWRALYAFPGSFMLVAGLKEGFEFMLRGVSVRSKALLLQLAVVSVVVCVSLVPTFPYRGRLWFVLLKPSQQLSLEPMDETSQWLHDNDHRDLNCLLAGDGATAMALAATLGLKEEPERLTPRDSFQLTSKASPFVSYLQSNRVCGLVVAVPSKIMPVPRSRVGQLSGHWDPAFVDDDLVASGNIDAALASLTAAGWTRTSVPPFYWLYKPPARTSTTPAP